MSPPPFLFSAARSRKAQYLKERPIQGARAGGDTKAPPLGDAQRRATAQQSRTQQSTQAGSGRPPPSLPPSLRPSSPSAREREASAKQQQEQQQGSARQDTTALEIAANESFFGGAGASSSGADEPWGASFLLSTTSPLADDWGYADGSAAALSGRAPAQFFRSPYVDAAPATGGARRTAGDPTSASVTTAAAVAASATTATTSNSNAGMGNYDRDYHLRMQMQPAPRTGMTVSPHPHHHSANSSFPQQPPPQYAAQTQGYRSYAPQEHSRLKAGGATSPLATPSGMGPSYFHQILETDRRGGNTGQAALYTSSGMAGGYAPSSGYTGVDTAKRGRGNSSTGGNNGSSSGSNSSFLPTLDALPFLGPGNSSGTTSGYASPPGGSTFDADHPLPDFSADWFVGRISPPHASSSAMTSTSMPLPHPSPTGLFGGVSSLNTSHGHPGGPTVNVSGAMDDSSTSGGAASSGNGRLGGLSGLPSPSGIFNVDALLPDYEASLYSLWNNSGNGPIGYDQDNEQQHSHAPSQPHSQPQSQSQAQKPTSPHMYISAEDELKMDYPTLSEFNQGELDYLYDPMETGGPSPTTPLGTTPGSSVNKGDHYVGPHRGSVGTSREPHIERLVGSSDYLVKREQSTGSEESSRASKKPRSAFGGSFSGGSGNGNGNARLGGNSVSSGGGFRSLARNATIESKRPMGTSAAAGATYHSGGTTSAGMTTGLPHQSSQHMTSGTAKTPATAAGTTPTSSGEGGGSGGTSKRPRSRQCDFPGCTNRARSHQKCKKHGGAHQCVFDGCTKNSQSRGLCIAHGGGSRCKVKDCVRAAQSKGLCKTHGGGEFCAVEGCRKKAHLKHLCRTHGGGVRCKFAKCSKWAQRKGWCMAHAKEFLGT